MALCAEHGEIKTRCEFAVKAAEDQWSEINMIKRSIVGRATFWTMITLIGGLLAAILGLNYYMQDKLFTTVQPLNTKVAIIKDRIDRVKEDVDQIKRIQKINNP